MVAYLAGAKVNGERPAVLQVITPAFLMGMAAIGMWRARYWAVLGFEVVLAFLILSAAIGLVGATSADPGRRQRRPDLGRRGALLLHDQGDGPHPDAGAAVTPAALDYS